MYLSRRDVFVSASTGAGKSLTLQLALHTFDCLNGESYSCNSNAVILVHVVLLILLMKDQVSNLNSCGISASHVGDCSEKQLQNQYIPQFKSRTCKGNLRHQLLVTPLLIFWCKMQMKTVQ